MVPRCCIQFHCSMVLYTSLKGSLRDQAKEAWLDGKSYMVNICLLCELCTMKYLQKECLKLPMSSKTNAFIAKIICFVCYITG